MKFLLLPLLLLTQLSFGQVLWETIVPSPYTLEATRAVLEPDPDHFVVIEDIPDAEGLVGVRLRWFTHDRELVHTQEFRDASDNLVYGRAEVTMDGKILLVLYRDDPNNLLFVPDQREWQLHEITRTETRRVATFSWFQKSNYRHVARVVAMPDGGYLISDLIYDALHFGAAFHRARLIRLNADGSRRWKRHFDAEDNGVLSSFTAFAETESLYVNGYRPGGELLLKLDPNDGSTEAELNLSLYSTNSPQHISDLYAAPSGQLYYVGRNHQNNLAVGQINGMEFNSMDYPTVFNTLRFKRTGFDPEYPEFIGAGFMRRILTFHPDLAQIETQELMYPTPGNTTLNIYEERTNGANFGDYTHTIYTYYNYYLEDRTFQNRVLHISPEGADESSVLALGSFRVHHLAFPSFAFDRGDSVRIAVDSRGEQLPGNRQYYLTVSADGQTVRRDSVPAVPKEFFYEQFIEPTGERLFVFERTEELTVQWWRADGSLKWEQQLPAWEFCDPPRVELSDGAVRILYTRQIFTIDLNGQLIDTQSTPFRDEHLINCFYQLNENRLLFIDPRANNSRNIRLITYDRSGRALDSIFIPHTPDYYMDEQQYYPIDNSSEFVYAFEEYTFESRFIRLLHFDASLRLIKQLTVEEGRVPLARNRVQKSLDGLYFPNDLLFWQNDHLIDLKPPGVGSYNDLIPTSSPDIYYALGDQKRLNTYDVRLVKFRALPWVKSLERAPPETLHVAPNPSGGHFRWQLRGFDAILQEYWLYDVSGRELLRQQLPAPYDADYEAVKMDLSSEPAGVYWLGVRLDTGEVVYARVVVVR